MELTSEDLAFVSEALKRIAAIDYNLYRRIMRGGDDPDRQATAHKSAITASAISGRIDSHLGMNRG
jgi:hypothetical protein